jgi:hypothetical protein
VKVLFDHNIPHKLRHSMSAHDVSTADEMGWAVPTNNWNVLKHNSRPVVEAVDAATPGSFQVVELRL